MQIFIISIFQAKLKNISNCWEAREKVKFCRRLFFFGFSEDPVCKCFVCSCQHHVFPIKEIDPSGFVSLARAWREENLLCVFGYRCSQNTFRRIQVSRPFVRRFRRHNPPKVDWQNEPKSVLLCVSVCVCRCVSVWKDRIVGERQTVVAIHHRSTSSRRRLGGRGGRSADPATIAVLVRRRRNVFPVDFCPLFVSPDGRSSQRRCSGSLHSGSFTTSTSSAQSRAFHIIVGPLRSTNQHIHGSTQSKFVCVCVF